MATTFDLAPELNAALKEIAAAERRSVTQTIIIALEEYVHRHHHSARVDALAGRIADEDAELLRRLA
jgi:predicted transcriptional regulator